MSTAFTRIALLFSFSCCLSPSWAQETINFVVFTKEGTGYPSRSGEVYNEDVQGNLFLDGCEDDIVTLQLESDGHFALVANNQIITTTIDGVVQKVESDRTGYLRVRLIDLLQVYPTVQNRDDLSLHESVILHHIATRAPIIQINWKVGFNDTLALCTRTPYSPPTSIDYVTENSTYPSAITDEFGYKVNGVYSKKLDVKNLKNGDVLQLCKPKGVDGSHFPACSKETADTLFSQKVTVKLISTAGRLATQLASSYDLCRGDTLLLSQFYSQCIGYYMKDGQQISTTLWVDPNTSYYHPYKQTRVSVPGTYYLAQTPMLGCGEDYYNCPATSKDIEVKEKINCMVTNFTEATMEQKAPLYYPNPMEGELTIQTEQKGTWELLNLQGRVLKSLELEAGIHLLQLSEFPAGVYLSRFNMGEKVFYEKLTKGQ